MQQGSKGGSQQGTKGGSQQGSNRQGEAAPLSHTEYMAWSVQPAHIGLKIASVAAHIYE